MATGADVASAVLLVGSIAYLGYRVAKWCTRITPPMVGAVVACLGTQGAAGVFSYLFAAIFLPAAGDQATGHGMWLAYFVVPTTFLVSLFAAIYAGVENVAAPPEPGQSTESKPDEGKGGDTT